MPSTMTHTYFALDVYNHLNIRTKELLLDHKEMLKTAGQGMDPLFFYNILSLKKGKKIRNFGNYFHQNKTYEFFETLINYIKYNDYYYDGEVMAYLYGMLSHYVLDSSIHPFIIYKAGQFDKSNKSTYKYSQLHGEIESYIDNYFIAINENITPWKFKCYNFGINTTQFNKNLEEVINFSFKEVFNINNMNNIYLNSIKQMKRFYFLLRYDPIGIKKNLYNIFDNLTPSSLERTVPISYQINSKNKRQFLNLEHNIWYYPTDNKKKHKESFIELYDSSLNKTVDIINQINEYIYNDKKINLKKVIGNLSYFTGKDCDKEKELKYFEF